MLLNSLTPTGSVSTTGIWVSEEAGSFSGAMGAPVEEDAVFSSVASAPSPCGESGGGSSGGGKKGGGSEGCRFSHKLAPSS